MARSVAQTSSQQVLYSTKGGIEAAWKTLEPKLLSLIPARGSVRVWINAEYVPGKNQIAGSLMSNEHERAERQLGGTVPVVKLLSASKTHPGFWLSWTQLWTDAGKLGFAYHTTGLTVYSETGSRRTQLFRAEWAGVREMRDGEPIYEAQGAGHPHWQFDAPVAFARLQEEIAKRMRFEAQVREEDPPVEEFNDGVRSPEFAPLGQNIGVLFTAAELRWTRMHFASLATWAPHPWNGHTSSTIQHARGPASTQELQNWVLSSIRYILRELQR